MTRNPEETYGKQWKWEKVGDGGSGGALVNGERKSNSNGWRSNEEGAKGEQTWGKADGGGGCEVYRWRHTEAVRLLERALAVHREVRAWANLKHATGGLLLVRPVRNREFDSDNALLRPSSSLAARPVRKEILYIHFVKGLV